MNCRKLDSQLLVQFKLDSISIEYSLIYYHIWLESSFLILSFSSARFNFFLSLKNAETFKQKLMARWMPWFEGSSDRSAHVSIPFMMELAVPQETRR
jgi:hypothetical protein